MTDTSTEQPLLWADRVALIVLECKSLLGQKVDSLSTGTNKKSANSSHGYAILYSTFHPICIVEYYKRSPTNRQRMV